MLDYSTIIYIQFLCCTNNYTYRLTELMTYKLTHFRLKCLHKYMLTNKNQVVIVEVEIPEKCKLTFSLERPAGPLVACDKNNENPQFFYYCCLTIYFAIYTLAYIISVIINHIDNNIV